MRDVKTLLNMWFQNQNDNEICTFGANSVLIGSICIGNNVTIGAGSVVIKDVPDNVCVADNPARIISNNGLIAGKGY